MAMSMWALLIDGGGASTQWAAPSLSRLSWTKLESYLSMIQSTGYLYAASSIVSASLPALAFLVLDCDVEV